MVDIVKRLRNGLGDPFEHVIEAADEIEKLREERNRLREERDKLKEALRSLIALTATALKEKE